MSLIVRWLSVCYCVVLISTEDPGCGFEVPDDDVTSRADPDPSSSSFLDAIFNETRDDAPRVPHQVVLLDSAAAATAALEERGLVTVPTETSATVTSNVPGLTSLEPKMDRDFLVRQQWCGNVPPLYEGL